MSSRMGLLWFMVAAIGLLPVSKVTFAETSREVLEAPIDRPWSGDFKGMAKRRLIRALVVHNPMMYFLDKGRQRGAGYEMLKAFEQFVNRRQKTRTLKIQLVFIPVPRDQLLPALLEGRGDLAVANLTITKARQKLVDFSSPTISGISEILVTGPGAPPMATADDLSGKTLHVRRSSSYHEHLLRLNEDFSARGLEPVSLVPASEYMEDSDLLEMVNADLLEMVIVDSHKARFWAEVFTNVNLHPEIAVNSGGEIGWALRKNSPGLKAVVDEFISGHRKGTLFGNVIFKRYLKQNKWARNAVSKAALARYQQVVDLFRKYADRYRFDHLMITALAFQESGLDHNKKSPSGALGIMQVLPTTAAGKDVGIKDVHKLEDNIHAGTKYLRFLQDRYFSGRDIDQLNQMLLTFAAYNAGPAKVNSLRAETRRMGLDPNVWFHNVEVAAAKKVGRETVQYVNNIYKYYLAYHLVMEREAMREKHRSEFGR